MTDPLIGRLLCGYRVEKLLVRGKTESVYKATQVSVDRSVALKVLSAEAAEDRARTVSFVKRAQRAGKLKHPSVVEFHEVCQQGDFIFYSMEYLPGGSLGRWIEEHGPLSWRRLLPLVKDVSEALLYAEEQGVVHGSIHPDHLLFTLDGRMKVLHLGLGDPGGEPPEGGEKNTPAFLSFLAPEQIRRGRIDARADIYALGCTCYYSLCGRLPFAAETPEEVRSAKRLHRVTPLGDLMPDLPREVVNLVERMMALSPEKRFQSFRDVAGALERLAADLAAMERFRPTAPLGTAARRKSLASRDFAPLAALALAAAIVIALVIANRNRPGPPPPAPDVPVVVETPEKAVIPDAKAGLKVNSPPDDEAGVAGLLDEARQEIAQGRYREVISDLRRLAEKGPATLAGANETIENALEAAKQELRSAFEESDGHLALGESAGAVEVLEEILPRLPAELTPRAEEKLRQVRRVLAEREVDAARRSLKELYGRLDFKGAEQKISQVAEKAEAAGSDAISRLRDDLQRATQLWEALEAASIESWAELPKRFQQAYARVDDVSYAAFQSALLKTAALLCRDQLRQRKFASLFRGKAENLTGGIVHVVYDFSEEAQKEDFLPRPDVGSAVSVKGGVLELTGEARLLRGNPFRTRLELTMVVSRCDAFAPNINLAVWTQEGDRVTYGEVGRPSPPGADSLAERASGPEYLVFAMGYQPSSPLVDSLKMQHSGARILFPCIAILGGRHGLGLHEDLRWDCIWGANLLAQVRGAQRVEIVLRPGAFRWAVNTRSIEAEAGPQVAEALQAAAGASPTGSITLFTNGKQVAIDSVELTAELNDSWLDQVFLSRALEELEKAVPGAPWRETLSAIDLRGS